MTGNEGDNKIKYVTEEEESPGAKDGVWAGGRKEHVVNLRGGRNSQLVKKWGEKREK